MATISFFILLTLTLSLSSTIHARESQFFNKFSNNIPTESQTLNTNNQQQQQQQQQQQPDFIPESQDSGSYGLYGHQSNQLPPTTTTNNHLPSYLPENYNPVAYTTPIHSSTQDIPYEYKEQYNGDTKMYNSEKQGYEFGLDDAKFTETEDGGDMYNSEKQVEENGRYNSRMQEMGNNGNVYNNEKKGMSDTRFLENGKYYYDVNMENANYNANMNSRGFGSRNEYNTQGYYGNNNQNSYDRYNSNGGYQSQEDQFNP